MKKKIMAIVLALLFLIGIVFGYNSYKNNNEGEKCDKTITIDIYDQDELIGNVKCNTNASTLGEALIELSENNQIKLKYSDSDYGMFIEGLGIDNLIEQSGNKFWVYESDNNESCLKNGFCDAADILEIKDEDHFEFKLSVFE